MKHNLHLLNTVFDYLIKHLDFTFESTNNDYDSFGVWPETIFFENIIEEH